MLPFITSAQVNQVNIPNFTVKSQLPANTADWANIPGSLLLVAQKTPQSGSFNPKLVIQIRKGAGIICGNTLGNAISLDSFNVRTFLPTQLVSYLGQCAPLQPGDYSLCIQFFNDSKEAISRQVCKDFTVTNDVTECAPPVNIAPANNKVFQGKDLAAPITFAWSPLVLPGGTLVTYKLTVWEVEDGQTDAQAIYNNLPVLEQQVKGQTRYIVKPGFFERRKARYVWRVIAVNDQDKPVCRTAQSEATSFTTRDDSTLTLNTPCGNGDFESGILDPTEWSAGYTKIVNNNSTFSPPFNNIMQPANGNPIDAPINTGCGDQANENHHVIVSAGADPTIPALNRVPPSIIPNKYALRLGNNCPGCGTERIQKRFVVTAANTTYRFMYALVFEAPHDSTTNPSLWVRVYNANNIPVPGLVYLDPLSSLPMDRAVSDPANPYWQSYNGILYRDWACAKIDLSSLVGQVVTVEILTNDCAACGHFGYGYFDNFCIGCSNNPPPVDCCSDIIKEVSNTVTTLAGSKLKIAQQFTVAPLNIKSVTAEIISTEEDHIDTTCMKCTGKDGWAYRFISPNSTSWNSGVAMNGSPANSSSYYPSKMVEWVCNNQGNLKLNLTVSLPGTAAGCIRKGKICIRYRFTDINCKTCERIICYSFKSN